MPLKRNMCFSIQQDKAFFCDEVTLTQKIRRFWAPDFVVASAKKKTTSGAGEREKLKIQEAPPLL